jgi:hypothetical protein
MFVIGTLLEEAGYLWIRERGRHVVRYYMDDENEELCHTSIDEMVY